MINEEYLINIIKGSKEEQKKLLGLIERHQGTINCAEHLLEKLKEKKEEVKP